MATKDIGTVIAHEDALAASLKACGLHPAEVLEQISKTGAQVADCRLLDRGNLPTAKEALTNLRSTVKAETRVDSTVEIQYMSMTPEGYLFRDVSANPGSKPVYRTYTRHALCQVASRLPFHPAYAGPYWASIPSSRRAVEFKATIADNVAKDEGGYRLTLRLRRPRGESRHYIFAAVSDRYTKYDPDQMADDVLKALDSDADTMLCNVYYNGLRTSIRLILSNVQNFGIMAHLSTADDGTASINVGAELLLSSGATYAGKSGLHVSHRHIGGEHTVEDIQAALSKIGEAVEPWVKLWTDAGNNALPLTMSETIRAMTGDIENASKRGAFVKVADMSPSQLSSYLHTIMDQGIRGEIANYVPKATQAGLAELLLIAAGKASTEAVRQALQTAGENIVSMTATALARALLPRPTKKNKWEISPENQQLADQIAAMAKTEADKWYKKAEELEAEGDEEGAATARERAEMRLVEGDLLQEKGNKSFGW